MITKRQFEAKFGDPTAMHHDGQVWETSTAAGHLGGRKCCVHHRPIRFCFIVYLYEYGNPIRKLEVGPCCIPLFRRWNRHLYRELYHSYRTELVSRALQQVDRRLIREMNK